MAGLDDPDRAAAGARRLGPGNSGDSHDGRGAAVVVGRSDPKGLPCGRGRTVGLSVPLLLLATSAFAQVAPNTTTRYLFPTDVSDARALWVNAAGLAAFPAASVHLDLTVGDPGASGKLRQLTFGLIPAGCRSATSATCSATTNGGTPTGWDTRRAVRDSRQDLRRRCTGGVPPARAGTWASCTTGCRLCRWAERSKTSDDRSCAIRRCASHTR